jgi:equilibrative nucleoside transporter 1/2/3
LLLLVVFFLNVSGSYFQSAALALASLWGSTEILAALSGQGGIAVLISLVQVVLAVASALGSTTSQQIPDGDEAAEVPSMIAGVGLWALGTVGAVLCWLAFKFLASHPSYDRIATVKHHDHADQGPSGGVGPGRDGNWDRTVKVLGKNKLLYLAVALDFAITLVSALEYN